MRNNPIAVKVNCYKGFSFQQMIDGISKAGFTKLELSASKGNNAGLSTNSTPEQLDQLVKQLNEKGLSPFSFGGRMSLLDDSDIDGFIKKLQIAHYLQCKYVVCSVDDVHLYDGPVVSGEEVAKAAEKYIPYLREYGLQLNIELHGKYSTGKQVAQICKASDPELIKVNYDTGNALYWAGLSTEQMLDDLRQSVDMVGYMHMKDTLAENNEWNFPAIGKGYMPFDEVFEIIGEDIPLIVEIEYTDKGISDVKEADQALMDSAAFLKEKGFTL